MNDERVDSMPSVKNILDALFVLAPIQYKMEWDNVGLMCGHSGKTVTSVLVALDATEDVAEEAAARGCELVVVHHPLIFHGADSVSDLTPTGKRLLAFIENGIAVISMHTNLDCAPGGVNDVLAARLGLQNVQVDASELIRYGEVVKQPLQDFLPLVKERLSCPGLRYADAGKPVCRVAVGGGACGDYAETAAALGCDTFVTADLKYHNFADAAALGINLIDAGHFETENPVVGMLQAKLAAQFPGISVFISEMHGDVTRFV